MSVDSESQLFRILPSSLLNKIERPVYNQRKRKLFYAQDQIYKKLAQHFNEFKDSFIMDSMPLEVCKLSRASQSKICRESFENKPNRGYYTSQSMSSFVYKLDAICSVNGVIENFDLSKGSVHDIQYLKEMKDCILFS